MHTKVPFPLLDVLGQTDLGKGGPVVGHVVHDHHLKAGFHKVPAVPVATGQFVGEEFG